MENILKAHPERLSVRIQLGNEYLREKQFDKVIALFNPYTDLLTDQGFLALANAYSNKKDFVNEVRVLNLLAAKNEKKYQWHMLLGEAYLKLAGAQPKDQYEKRKNANTAAIEEFRKTMKLEPSYRPAFDILLKTFLQLKEHGEARELISQGLSKYGDLPRLQAELCRLDSNDGFLAQAVKNCKKAIEVSPAFPDSHVYLAQALFDQDQEQPAQSEIVSSARKFPKSEFVQWSAGTLFLKKKNYAVAQRYFQTALTADPKSSRAEFGLAQCLFETGSEEQSFAHFERACAADPSTVDKFFEAGGRLKQKGNYLLGEKFVRAASTCRK